MYVRFEWPRCDFLNGKWSLGCVDSFIVEATPFEAENLIMPHLTKDRDTYYNNRKQWDGKEYFLVSRDLSSIVSVSWDYPISHQWGVSPFKYKEVLIRTLADLSEI